MPRQLDFYYNPQSRASIVFWMLEEVGADYRIHRIDLEKGDHRTPEFLAINPMGKVPTIVHHTPGGDRVVTEAAAVCHYLAEMHPQANLLPKDDEMADYFRWLFFAAGPVEQAVTSRMFKFDPSLEQQGMVGFGSFERTMSTLEKHLDGRSFVCGERFTMADVYVGSAVDWGLNFGIMPPRPAFVAYAERVQNRTAYKAAKAIDNTLIAEMKK